MDQESPVETSKSVSFASYILERLIQMHKVQAPLHMAVKQGSFCLVFIVCCLCPSTDSRVPCGQGPRLTHLWFLAPQIRDQKKKEEGKGNRGRRGEGREIRVGPCTASQMLEVPRWGFLLQFALPSSVKRQGGLNPKTFMSLPAFQLKKGWSSIALSKAGIFGCIILSSSCNLTPLTMQSPFEDHWSSRDAEKRGTRISQEF